MGLGGQKKWKMLEGGDLRRWRIEKGETLTSLKKRTRTFGRFMRAAGFDVADWRKCSLSLFARESDRPRSR
jgi:hypothetical protein